MYYIYIYIYVCWTLPKHWFTKEFVKVHVLFMKKTIHTAFQSFGNPQLCVYIYISHVYMPRPFQHVHYTPLRIHHNLSDISQNNALQTEKDLVILL